MKKYLLALLTVSILHNHVHAQKCLNISIAKMMGTLSMTPGAAYSFKKCVTNKNDHSQSNIVNYGADLQELDTLVARTTRNFNNAYAAEASGASRQMPSQQDVNAAKGLAEDLKSMTPDQQKAFAMQMAQQRQKNAGASSMQDDPMLANLVMKTNDMAVNQMKALDDEFSAKLKAIDDAMLNEINAIQKDDKNKCPQDITGLPNCACANKIEGKYWQQAIVVTDKYNHQKATLFLGYLEKIKSMAATIDASIVKCKNGDALRSPNFKQMLFSAQSAAFGNAFLVTAMCVKDVRKSGADAFNNKANCDAGTYDVSCSK